ncbi:MAG: hypothetical protein H6492_02350 [Candidatus Paracaedibacteraceae bacterium]|nr:hypothetical protein [Candidatus Paracaedibacteraceae bacterium]
MKKTLLSIIFTTSLLTSTQGAAADMAADTFPDISTAAEAITHGATLSQAARADFFVIFAERNNIEHAEIFALAKTLRPEQAIEILEVYVSRPDSTKAGIKDAAKFIKGLPKKYKYHASNLEAVAEAMK